jgi:hypothetical protein
VSSILEALRELEGERPPAARREIPKAEPPSTGLARRTAGAFIPILGGLAVGIVAVGLWAFAPSLRPDVMPSSIPGAPATADVAAVPAPAAEPPAWLDQAEPPRARVNAAPIAAPPERVAAPERAPAPATRRASAPEPPTDTADEAPPPPRTGGQVAIESISYSDNVGARVATMRVHGRRVSLRQRESVDGIEVQLIMPNGVYVQRGGEVYLLPLTR